MNRITLNNALNIKELQNELELERASSLYLRLRPVEKQNPDYPGIRKHLEKLILAYEEKHWSDPDKISDEQIEESDLAELLVQAENEFNYKRKKVIKSHLKATGFNQNDLARILGHRKSYMSELINGLRPFSREDLIVLNKLFKIKLEDLFPTFIKQQRVVEINETLEAMNIDKIKLSYKDMDLQLPG